MNSDDTRSAAASKAPAVAKAAAILRLLGSSEVPLGVHPIARELDLVPSTCLNLLRALVAERFVAFDPHSKRYSLEVGILMLGRNWLMRNAFNDIAQPFLNQISREFDVTAFGVKILDLDHIVIIAASQAAPNFMLSAHIGSRFPALLSATGRCIAAFGGHDEQQLREKFTEISWDEPMSYDDWAAQIPVTRARGFGMDDGEQKTGALFIAAPVWSEPGKLTHSITATTISGALDAAAIDRLQHALVRAAHAISLQLSGQIGG